MSQNNLPQVIEWIISGSVGLFFGIILSWINYRYEKKRDNIAWQREKENIQQQFKHDSDLLEALYKQRSEEIKEQQSSDRNYQLRQKLTQGIDDPKKAIEAIEQSDISIRSRGYHIRINTEQIPLLVTLIKASISESQSQVRKLQYNFEGLQSIWEDVKSQRFYQEWQEYLLRSMHCIKLLYSIANQLDSLWSRFQESDTS